MRRSSLEWLCFFIAVVERGSSLCALTYFAREDCPRLRLIAGFLRDQSATAKLGWIIVGRRVIVVGPQTTRNGVVAINLPTTRSHVGWAHSVIGTDDEMLRFVTRTFRGGGGRNTEGNHKAERQSRTHCIFSIAPSR